MSEDKSTSTQRERAYKEGREGTRDILGTDNKGEAQARDKGLQDKINAEQTKKENEQKEADKKKE